ncbi:MAG: hypothetical protein HYZ44_12775 [Bacteroidetes bacterium]|nr:hypothetical protein [Bacteroidota bacterium]
MKKIIYSLFVLITSVSIVLAQDEGSVVKRERIDRDKSIFVGAGISVVGGSNFGDYSNGINFEAGYTKRLNRVLSIGGSLSYLKFAYDPSILEQTPNGKDIPNYVYYDKTITDLNNVNEIWLLSITGGDVSMISLAGTIKLNFVPVKDNSIVSVYGYAKPFVSMANVSKATGRLEYYYYASNDWFADTDGDLAGEYEDNSFSGGIFLGPGIEFFPAKKVSFFAQASFGYTFPIKVISTRSYGNDINKDVVDDFPLKASSFTSINFAAGISFNLD